MNKEMQKLLKQINDKGYMLPYKFEEDKDLK